MGDVMRRHVFLTGEIQIGKSTAIRRFLRASGVDADGFVSRIVFSEGRRELHIARFDTSGGVTDSRLAAIVGTPRAAARGEAFDSHGAGIVESCGARRLIIFDELGVLEENATRFKTAVIGKLGGRVPALGVVKKAESAFLDAIRGRPDVDVITVTAENRDEIPELLARRFHNLLGGAR
jgi:nucleoside-triphosphatase